MGNILENKNREIFGNPIYKRLLDKNDQPTDAFIREYLGKQGYLLLTNLEDALNNGYQLIRELKFPFGNDYGWGYKYSHKSAHLCYAFFETGAFCVTLQLGDKCVPKIEQIIPSLLPKTLDLWKNRYPCGEHGGWVHYRIFNDDELSDVVELVNIKKKPNFKDKGVQ